MQGRAFAFKKNNKTMKNNRFRTVLAALAMITLSSSTFAENYIYDIKEDQNGNVVAQTVFEENNSMLTPKLRHAISYMADGRISRKDTQKWNGKKWVPESTIDYTYDGDATTIVLTRWEGKRKTVRTDCFVHGTVEGDQFLTRIDRPDLDNMTDMMARTDSIGGMRISL